MKYSVLVLALAAGTAALPEVRPARYKFHGASR